MGDGRGKKKFVDPRKGWAREGTRGGARNGVGDGIVISSLFPGQRRVLLLVNNRVLNCKIIN